MADVIVIPTSQNLPDGFCPTDWQDTVDAFAAAMRVTLPSDYGQIVISDTTPDPADRDKIWFQVVSPTNLHVLAIRSWDSSTGSWERADETPYYFVDTGSANAVQVSTGDSISTLSDLTGRMLFVKVAATNTSSATTLAVDSTAATTVKKYGSSDVEPGDLTVGMIAIFIYDGTQYQFLNPKITPNTTITKKFVTDGLAVATQDITASGLTSPQFVQVWYECVTGDAGYSTGDLLDVGAVIADYDLGDSEEGPYISVSVRGNIIHLEAVTSPAQIYTTQRGTGTDQTTFTPSNWTISVIAIE